MAFIRGRLYSFMKSEKKNRYLHLLLENCSINKYTKIYHLMFITRRNPPFLFHLQHLNWSTIWYWIFKHHNRKWQRHVCMICLFGRWYFIQIPHSAATTTTRTTNCNLFVLGCIRIISSRRTKKVVIQEKKIINIISVCVSNATKVSSLFLHIAV